MNNLPESVHERGMARNQICGFQLRVECPNHYTAMPYIITTKTRVNYNKYITDNRKKEILVKLGWKYMPHKVCQTNLGTVDSFVIVVGSSSNTEAMSCPWGTETRQ